jgi:hypothetical protein
MKNEFCECLEVLELAALDEEILALRWPSTTLNNATSCERQLMCGQLPYNMASLQLGRS